MEADSWTRFSKRHQAAALQSRFDLYLGFDEVEGNEDDARAEFACPFCSEDFDVVGLCCHIQDEHPVEAKNGVCPVCATRVGFGLVGHITTQHSSTYKIQHKRRPRKSSSGSTLSMFRKDIRERNLQSILGGSSYLNAPANVAADPLLSSFIMNLPVAEADSPKVVHPATSDDGSVVQNSSDETLTESENSISDDEERQERARRSAFVQEMLLSTIFDEVL